ARAPPLEAPPSPAPPLDEEVPPVDAPPLEDPPVRAPPDERVPPADAPPLPPEPSAATFPEESSEPQAAERSPIIPQYRDRALPIVHPSHGADGPSTSPLASPARESARRAPALSENGARRLLQECAARSGRALPRRRRPGCASALAGHRRE